MVKKAGILLWGEGAEEFKCWDRVEKGII